MSDNPIDQIATDFTIPKHLRQIVLMLVQETLRMDREQKQLVDRMDELRNMVYPLEPTP